MLLILLIILLFVFFGGGFYSPGAEAGYPYRPYGFGLGFIVLIVLLVLLFSGYGPHLRH